MERTEAVELVATTIARYPHVTHLRLRTRGSFSSRSRIEVMTLGQPGAKRTKGTREQEYIGFEGDMFARPDDLPASTWFEVFEALDPSIYFASGCAEQTGFDVDAAGNITNRRGSKAQAIKAERKHRAAMERLDTEADEQLADEFVAASDAHEAQRRARVDRVHPDSTVIIHHALQAGSVDRMLHDHLHRKAQQAGDAEPARMLIDLDSVLHTGYGDLTGTVSSAPARHRVTSSWLEDFLPG